MKGKMWKETEERRSQWKEMQKVEGSGEKHTSAYWLDLYDP